MDLKPKDILQRVIRFARGLPVRPALPRIDPPTRAISAVGAVSAAGDADADGDADAHADVDEVRGLEVAHRSDGALVLRWSVDADDVARAGALVAGQPVLCLRVVSFTKERDDVLREVQDRPGIALQGECEIGEPPERAIVALGVRVGDRFVSIAHHVV